jgi:hypothetical protein
MNQYLLIESRDPFESNDVAYYFELARDLAASGNEVTLYLVQNGVLAARPSKKSSLLTALAGAGVSVVADDFSLAERGITRLADGLRAQSIELVVDHLAAGHKTLWH